MNQLGDIAGRTRPGSRLDGENSPSFAGAPAIELSFEIPPGSSLAEAGASNLWPLDDITSIRPGEGQSSAPEHAPGGARSWGVGPSLAMHLAVLAALLTWSTPVAEAPPPEAVAVEVVVEPPPPVEEPKTLAEAPLQVEEQPAPVAPPVESAPTPPAEEKAAPAEAPPPPVEGKAAPAEAPAPPDEPSIIAAPAAPPISPPRQPSSPKTIATPTPKEPAPVRPRPTPPRTPPAPASSTARPTPPAAATGASRAAAAGAVGAPKADTAAYQSEVLARIAAQKRYPEAALARAPQGVAVVRFSIDASGQVVGASLARSAGDPVLDAEAVATVRRASPFPPPPAGTPRNFAASLNFRAR